MHRAGQTKEALLRGRAHEGGVLREEVVHACLLQRRDDMMQVGLTLKLLWPAVVLQCNVLAQCHVEDPGGICRFMACPMVDGPDSTCSCQTARILPAQSQTNEGMHGPYVKWKQTHQLALQQPALQKCSLALSMPPIHSNPGLLLRQSMHSKHSPHRLPQQYLLSCKYLC